MSDQAWLAAIAPGVRTDRKFRIRKSRAKCRSLGRPTRGEALGGP
jgi:hypothetical protein